MESNISVLYNNYPELYDVIANDRDFSGQINSILSCADVNTKRAIEMCAGPARHSLALDQLQIDTYSIDNSHSMMYYATNTVGIDKSKYFVADLKDASISWNIPNDKPIDLILLLRYSIGYFSKLELYNLINECKNISRPGSLMILELHDLNFIRSDLKKLSIQYREINVSNQKKISCAWPHGNPIWDTNDWKLSMKVLIKDNSNGIETEKLFISQEHIHSVNDIMFIAKLLGLEIKLLNGFESVRSQFNHSNLVGIIF